MKAFFITAPGATEIREIKKPVPGPEEVLLKVKFVGFCGSDLSTYRGMNSMAQMPCIPGHEIAATILEKGTGVPQEFKPGLNVTVSPYKSCGTCTSCLLGRANACQFNQTLGVQREGAMAEYIVAPWQKVYQSQKLSLHELALVEPLSVGFHAANRGEITKKDVVAVFGCGAIGLGVVAGAHWHGAQVIAIDVDDKKLEVARRIGAAHVINTKKENLHEILQELTKGHGPNVTVEAIGRPETYISAVEEVSFCGRVVFIGYSKESVTFQTSLFVQKELSMRGSRNAGPDDFSEAIAMLEGGRFPEEALITRIVKLDEAGDALRRWDENPSIVTRIMVEM